MRLSFNCILFFFIIVSRSYGQHYDSSRSLMQQANKMGDAFMRGDYKTFTHYTYPKIVELMGGADKMAEDLSKTTINTTAKGIILINIRFGEVSKIFKSGNELQCTLPQYSKIKLPNGSAEATSTLIAISADNGNHWTFVDTSNKDMSTIRKLLPHLSKEIVIPPMQTPVRYNN